jgi:hypothetical protein
MESSSRHEDALRRMTREQPLRDHARSARSALCIALILLAASLLFTTSTLAAEPASVTFSLDFPNSSPEHYKILVQSDGQAHYESSGKISADSDARDDYATDFVFSGASRVRIFELAAQAHYFSGKVDSGNKKLAFTGAKKLIYKDGQRDSSADYNYSSQPAVQQLTTLFQSVAATLEYGRRLVYYHHYQKLALDDELKHMEDETKRGNLVELNAVTAVLQQIYDDSSVMNVVRARAQRIMILSKTPPAGH